MSSFQGVGIEGFHCVIQKCSHFRGIDIAKCLLFIVVSCFLSSSPAFELSPKKYHTVLDKTTTKKRRVVFLQKLGVKNSDVDIIEV